MMPNLIALVVLTKFHVAWFFFMRVVALIYNQCMFNYFYYTQNNSLPEHFHSDFIKIKNIKTVVNLL